MFFFKCALELPNFSSSNFIQGHCTFFNQRHSSLLIKYQSDWCMREYMWLKKKDFSHKSALTFTLDLETSFRSTIIEKNITPIWKHTHWMVEFAHSKYVTMYCIYHKTLAVSYNTIWYCTYNHHREKESYSTFTSIKH